MQLKKLPTLAAAVALACASSAYAQNVYEPAWSVMPYVSGFHPDSIYGVTGASSGASGWGGGGGLRLSKTLGGDFEVQLNASYARRDDSGNKIDQTLLDVGFSYFFNRTEWQPFVTLGVGAQRDHRELFGVDTSGTSPSANAGAGIRYMFNRDFGIQLEYRRVEGFMTKASSWGFNRSGNNYVNLGLLWAFNAAPPPPPRVVAAPPPPPPAPIVAPEPPPIPMAPPAPPMPTSMTIEASRLFELNSARVSPSVPELDSYAAALNANPGIGRVMITGHTDQLGTASYNNHLSLLRANAVKAYLVKKGVNAKRLETKGVGSTQLIVQCKGPRPEMITCGAPNRRVVLEQITVPAK